MLGPAVLLDTNICIYILADAESVAAQRLRECSVGEAVASVITYAEVMREIDTADDAAAASLKRFFDIVPVRPFTLEAAEAYASMKFRRGSFDRLIAAHALAEGLILVTNDPSDFRDIAGLRVENWTRA